MAITYSWKVTGLKKTSANNLNDVVIGTQWQCIGTDEDGNTGKFSGATPFKAANIDPENFVGFNNLTEEIVLSWIQGSVTGPTGYFDHISEQIQKQIDQKKNPVVQVDQMPWVSDPSVNT